MMYSGDEFYDDDATSGWVDDLMTIDRENAAKLEARPARAGRRRRKTPLFGTEPEQGGLFEEVDPRD